MNSTARATPDTRDKLLAAARDAYLEAGTDGFSLREVARRVGVSPAAVYRHFDAKEALLAAACEQGFQIFSSYLVRAIDEATPLARMRAAAVEYKRFGLENPTDYRFIFMTTRSSDPAQSGKPGANRGSSTYRFLIDRVRECIDEGHFRKDDPEEVAAIIWVNVHGLVSLRLAGHMAVTDAEFDKFYARATERLLKSLLR